LPGSSKPAVIAGVGSAALGPRSNGVRAEAQPNHFDIAIVGSGFAGIGAGHYLKREGIDDFVILERADDVGGAWWWNTYPGCQCDIPSHLYSFSFAPNPNWSQTYPLQREFHAYLRDCAQRFGLMRHIRFGHELLSVIPGRDSFEGHAFHSSRWDHSVDLRGKKVAVVGTGASSIQIVPNILRSISSTSSSGPHHGSCRTRGGPRAN
jgi:cation diffusion facilitator CzcD-associated flavoprotein CzcO